MTRSFPRSASRSLMSAVLFSIRPADISQLRAEKYNRRSGDAIGNGLVVLQIAHFTHNSATTANNQIVVPHPQIIGVIGGPRCLARCAFKDGEVEKRHPLLRFFGCNQVHIFSKLCYFFTVSIQKAYKVYLPSMELSRKNVNYCL